MTLTEQIYAQALLLAGELEPKQKEMLKVLCQGSRASLAPQMREGLKPEDCMADFVAAASLFALAALSDVQNAAEPELFQAGDMTIRKRTKNPAANCLRSQAELMIAPYLQDRVTFLGV